jgi:hypothetical protein
MAYSKEKNHRRSLPLIALQSKLTDREMDYVELKDQLERHWFSLSGNWDYMQGSFDRRLDGEAQTVWLRIPFEAVHGQIDPDQPQPGTRVKIGQPYVLKHVYHIGDDHTAHFYTLGALVNQFQSPTDPDGEVTPSFVMEAQGLLEEVEGAVL